jgi:hypothetical protein
VRPRAALAASAAALALLAALPAAADAAGSYTVNACSPSTSAGAWQQIDTSTASMTSGNDCGGPMIGPVGSGDTGSLYGEDLVGSTTEAASGSEAGWEFTAPNGTDITAVSYYRSLDTVTGAGDWQAGLFAANGTALDICETNPTPCSRPNNEVPVSLTGLDTTGLFFGIYCNSPGPDECVPGGIEHSVQAQMYSIAVTLSETALPSVSNLAGPLWTGGVVWGTQTVTFAASDPSGIARIALDGAGGQVALQPQSCNYAQTQPCPDLPAGSASLNTAMLADGTQTLSLLVTNAAGNTQTVLSPIIVVDNNGPPAPEQLAASPIAGSTTAVQLTWSDPVNPPQPVSNAQAEICQASCGSPVALGASGSAQLAVPGPGTYGVRLWLIDTAGRGGPSNAATATVTVPPAAVIPEPSLHLTHKLTGHKLTLTAKVPARISGRVTFTLRAYDHSRRIAMTTRPVRSAYGQAVLHVVLSKKELHASRISVSAAAAGALAATIDFKG